MFRNPPGLSETLWDYGVCGLSIREGRRDLELCEEQEIVPGLQKRTQRKQSETVTQNHKIGALMITYTIFFLGGVPFFHYSTMGPKTL